MKSITKRGRRAKKTAKTFKAALPSLGEKKRKAKRKMERLSVQLRLSPTNHDAERAKKKTCAKKETKKEGRLIVESEFCDEGSPQEWGRKKHPRVHQDCFLKKRTRLENVTRSASAGITGKGRELKNKERNENPSRRSQRGNGAVVSFYRTEKHV